MTAERDTTDRYLSAFLSERIGVEMGGRISGIARFGIFVKLEETSADAMVPIRTLGGEYFHHDADSQTLMGADTGMVISLGQRVTVKLIEASPTTGGLVVDLLTLEGKELPKGRTRSRGKPPRRKQGAAKKKAAKTARKVKRKRS